MIGITTFRISIRPEAFLSVGSLDSRGITVLPFVFHNFKGCLPAFLDKRLRVETERLNISTGAVTSKCPVNTWQDLIRGRKTTQGVVEKGMA
jgi:hypothetical protein